MGLLLRRPGSCKFTPLFVLIIQFIDLNQDVQICMRVSLWPNDDSNQSIVVWSECQLDAARVPDRSNLWVTLDSAWARESSINQILQILSTVLRWKIPTTWSTLVQPQFYLHNNGVWLFYSVWHCHIAVLWDRCWELCYLHCRCERLGSTWYLEYVLSGSIGRLAANPCWNQYVAVDRRLLFFSNRYRVSAGVTVQFYLTWRMYNFLVKHVGEGKYKLSVKFNCLSILLVSRASEVLFTIWSQACT